jgi:hypothetical protein
MNLIKDLFFGLVVIFIFVVLVPISYELIGKYNRLLDYLYYAILFRIAFPYSFSDIRKDFLFLLYKIPYFFPIIDVEDYEIIEDNE